MDLSNFYEQFNWHGISLVTFLTAWYFKDFYLFIFHCGDGPRCENS